MKPITACLLICFMPLVSFCQVVAGFSTDKRGDCSPATIRFTNTSSGITDAVSFLWEFGNGNTSVLRNPSAVFIGAGIYTVKLTVTQGGQVSTYSSSITVYQNPVVDFTVNKPDICIPAPAVFTSSSSAGDGSISSYHWDFGDGQTGLATGPGISHNYQTPQTATVSLTAKNSYGCSGSAIKNNIVTIHRPLTAAFSTASTIFCQAPATVSFANQSTGPGTISYNWEFGDGTTSTALTPTHTYTTEGLYTVRLTVSNELGCSNTSVRNAYIRVGGFTASFQEPPVICLDRWFTINNTSSPTPERSEWWLDGADIGTSWGNSAFSLAIASPGDHTLELRSFFGPCSSVSSKTITVKKNPELAGFLVNIPSLCGAPVAVSFEDTTAAAVSWSWNFDSYTQQSVIRNPSYTFNWDSHFNVQLTVANADGCTATTAKQVQISRPLVGIFLPPGQPIEACEKLSVPFEYRSTEELVSWTWDFGDNQTSTEAAPVHEYTQPGNYSVSLTYTTVSGCTGTVTHWNPFRVRATPKASFTGPQQICGNTPVFFNPAGTTGFVTNFIWDFGDNTGYQWQQGNHQYWDQGVYNVTLIAVNDFCSDTLVKSAYVNVLSPITKIGAVERSCEGDRGQIVLEDLSRQAQSWHWDFGDGRSSSYNTYQQFVNHHYSASGMYKVVLTTTNGACTVRDSTYVYVLLKQSPLLKATVADNCADRLSAVLQLDGLLNYPNDSEHRYNFRIEDELGNDMTRYANYYYWNYSLPWSTQLNNLPPGEYRLRVISTSTVFNCNDTSNYVTISVRSPEAGFEILNNQTCFRDPLQFRDTSRAPVDGTISAIHWTFGDGQQTSSAAGATISHQYAAPGNYWVISRATDANGCSSLFSRMVSISGPKADFQFSPASPVQLNSTVSFINTSNIGNSPSVSYQWQIDGADMYNTYSPVHQFPVAGTYQVKLIARNNDRGCPDTMVKSLTVHDFRTGFNTGISLIGDHGNCPPVMARFTNTSTNYTRLVWDFGDGQVLENVYSPSHIYSEPGIYSVKLEIYGYNGLQEVQYDTVRVFRPTATLSAPDLEACPGESLGMNAPSAIGASTYQWDFGNGFLQQGTDSFAVHSFLDPGTYMPTLIVRDASGCANAVTGEPFIVHPDPIASATPAVSAVCRELPVQLQASGGTSYSWSPVTGLDQSNSATVLASPVTETNYRVTVTDEHGCTASASALVQVAQPFRLTGPPETDICKGSSVVLNVTGSNEIRWIGNTSGLSSFLGGSPLATPLSDIRYTAVGYDPYQCYTDTIAVQVNVRPLPLVDAGTDQQVFYGAEVNLGASGSNDITRWNWSPADYLNCTNCMTPIARPYNDMHYVVTATTAFGCTATDSVFIKAACSEANVFLPTAFSPNNDGLNDRLGIVGYGVSRVRSFKIFNRWGNLIVQKQNFLPNDAASFWDGRYGGVDAPAGVYVYMIELECSGGQVFHRKGTVTLIR